MVNCKFSTCEKKATRKSLCQAHYVQMRKGQDLKPIREMSEYARGRPSICSISNCEVGHRALGYCERHYGIFRTFKIKPEIYEQMVIDHDNKCAICHKECITGKNLSIDHDHETGEVRGLLCQSCNLGLGKFYDSIELLERAVSYLSRLKS